MLIQRIETIKAELMRRIAEAANAGDVDAIQELAEAMRTLTAETREALRIEKKLSAVEGIINSGGLSIMETASTLSAPVPVWDEFSDEDAPEEEGQVRQRRIGKAFATRVARPRFEQECQIRGKELRRYKTKGTLYSTERRKQILARFATQNRGGRTNWFMGASDGPIPDICPYDVIVFMCGPLESEITYTESPNLKFTGEYMVRYLIVPIEVLQICWRKLSRSGSDRQVKFVVEREGDHWYLQVPQGDRISLDHYVDAYHLL